MPDNMPGDTPDFPILPQHKDHSRRWQENLYVYPVLSRRSRGLSIGVNLNPDTACNFDCIYCQVDRTVVPRVRDVDMRVLRDELTDMIDRAVSRKLFAAPPFDDVPPELQVVRDIAFSGDGEPTTCPVFPEAVQLAAELRNRYGLHDTKLVLITDAGYLDRHQVVSALEVMDRNGGEIWAKLDAGTEAYYEQVNKPNMPLSRIVQNIAGAARVRPIVIQSMFLRIDGVGPSESEVSAYVQRLRDIVSAGGAIEYVQVYTVARPPALSSVTSLSHQEVDDIVRAVQEAGFGAEPFYGSSN